MGVRVLIVDDHAAFRMFARRLLTADGFDVVGEAADGPTALAAAMDLLPDVVVLDVQLPDIDGLQVADALARQPSPPIVVLTSSRARADYGPLLDTHPALGFIPKGELDGEALARLLVGPRASPAEGRSAVPPELATD